MTKLNFDLLDSKGLELNQISFDSIDGKFVKNLRLKLDITQIMLATYLGIAKKTVEKWEQGKNKITGTSARLLYLINKNPEILNEFLSFNQSNN